MFHAHSVGPLINSLSQSFSQSFSQLFSIFQPFPVSDACPLLMHSSLTDNSWVSVVSLRKSWAHKIPGHVASLIRGGCHSPLNLQACVCVCVSAQISQSFCRDVALKPLNLGWCIRGNNKNLSTVWAYLACVATRLLLSKPASSQCLRVDEIEIFEVLASDNPLRRAKPELQAA